MVSRMKPTSTMRVAIISNCWMDGNTDRMALTLRVFNWWRWSRVTLAATAAVAERAVGQQNGGGVQAHEAVGEIRVQPMRRVQRGHQRENAHGEQHMRGERGDEFQVRDEADDEAPQRQRPEQEGGGLVQVVHGAGIEREAALEQGRGVERESGQQQHEIEVIVLQETPAPKETPRGTALRP